jgi:S-(hydroxymethyl)glutathione dehydrogenase/alcohol dehydrogenase
MLVHQNAVVSIPDYVRSDTASILGCAVTTGIGAVTRGAQVTVGSTVAVIGTGGIGIAAIQGARLAGARRIIAIDVVPEKLEAARRFGATDVVNARLDSPVARVLELTHGGVDFSFEAVGSAVTVEQAFAMLVPRGIATVIGMVPEGQQIKIGGAELFLQEKRLQGSFMGSNQFKTDIPRYIELNKQGKLALDDMVTSYQRVKELGFRIAMSVGQHTNDKELSFYAVTPSGFEWELGWNPIIVDESTWQPTTHQGISIWGHTPEGQTVIETFERFTTSVRSTLHREQEVAALAGPGIPDH